MPSSVTNGTQGAYPAGWEKIIRVRVLITGASGLLGGRLALLLAPRFTVLAAQHRAAPPAGLAAVPLDLRSEASLAGALEAARPDAVVHAAACADADLCEREPETARLLNAVASERLAGLCRERGCHLVALSTDLVFAGDRSFSDETLEPRPVLEYGRSKRAAEEAVLAASPEFAVARVALVLGRGFGPRSTASEGVFWGLRSGRRARLFADQCRTPVDPESVADGLGRILERRGAGLYHLGGPERVSRHELGLRVARILGLDASLIEAALQSREPAFCPRPADCSMASGRAQRELRWEPRPLDSAIRESRPAPG
jgi:dTDP-4-dehydrorhamnose reductase